MEEIGGLNGGGNPLRRKSQMSGVLVQKDFPNRFGLIGGGKSGGEERQG